MAAALIAALGLDQPEVQSSSIAVLEKGNADSSFVLSCFMWECLVGRSARECRANGLLLPRPSETSTAVLLLTCHHSAAHYRNQSLKLGLNLTSLSQKGLFEELDLMKIISESFSTLKETSDEDLCRNGTIVVKSLFASMRTKLLKLKENFKSVCLIIGNVNDLLTSGVSNTQLFIFINYLQGLLSEITNLSLVISTHVSDDAESERLLGAFLKNASDFTVTVSALQTGLSKDVSGCLSVGGLSLSSGTYHYRLLDRQVKMFSPGASSV
ncbi:Elongator complex protein 6 [Frankliniella fusca]|uniref:Elongator complex protein 6 n=1 Tax=Frankliniella fusca TaxID=407009 RepID=A0AAE1L5V6_9NEOP|nr:Elongator complex protein 6 [Frankliniella fusca]